MLAAVLGTLIGAKLYYMLVITHDIRDLFSRAGFVFWGGFIGRSLAAISRSRCKKLNFMRIADVGGHLHRRRLRGGPHRLLGSRRRLRPPVERTARRRISRRRAAVHRAEHAGAVRHRSPPPGSSPDTVLAVHPDAALRDGAGLRDVR